MFSILSGGEVTSCVMNVSLNVDVGTAVEGITSVIKGSGVFVITTGEGVKVGMTPPNGVGVEYCPHREAFPPQDASKNEAVIKKLIRRFTKLIR